MQHLQLSAGDVQRPYIYQNRTLLSIASVNKPRGNTHKPALRVLPCIELGIVERLLVDFYVGT
jgi:hypothetical protein